MTALLLLSHEPADRVDRMVSYWERATRPGELVVAYGGPTGEFVKIAARKVFIDDPRLRTRDHQRERQSYTGVLRGALAALRNTGWEWLYLAEFDMLPLDQALWERLLERAEAEGADLLGHRVWRIDNTLHPHYASHLSTPGWLRWVASISRRRDRNVILSCMGCGQFWRRRALEQVIEQGEPEPAYLELQLPSVAHHLGFRVRGLAEQDRFISNDEIARADPATMRDTGGWVMHPLKNLWCADSRTLFGAAPRRETLKPLPPKNPASGAAADAQPMKGGWTGDVSGLLQRIARVATGPRPVHLLRGGARLAIGLPENRVAARAVIDLYHPHRPRGRLFSLLARSLVAFRIHRCLLRPEGGGGGLPEVPWLSRFAEEGRVGFVGSNPAHGPRCLVGGIDCGPDARPFVGKLGFDHSRGAILREAELLDRLAGRYPGVLRALSLESGADWALLRLPHLGFVTPQGMNDPMVVDLLVQWMSGVRQPIGEVAWAADLLARAQASGIDPIWCERLRRRTVHTALVHGDFAVWNLRVLPNGPCALDWEWAAETGVAGIDLAHGLRQDAVMIRKLPPASAVRWILVKARGRPWNSYLSACGWDGAHHQWLAFGLLHSHLNARSDSREMLSVLGLGLHQHA